MSRQNRTLQPTLKPHRSRCTTAICFSWKVFTVCLSHLTLVGLVISYCVAGAFIFEKLESEYETTIRQNIAKQRENITDQIWAMTNEKLFLKEDNWTISVEEHLISFENKIQEAIKNGWDGKIVGDTQWSTTGSLFYSIIVITTIGYGHIAPRTNWGKVTTIFYAILGIPLMLLCLSNIGDIMATIFRFLYWRVCCFICSREPRRNSSRKVSRNNSKMDFKFNTRAPPMRRSMRVSQRSADSGVVPSFGSGLVHAHSDPDLRSRQMQRSSAKGRLESCAGAGGGGCGGTGGGDYPERYPSRTRRSFDRNRGNERDRECDQHRLYDVERGGYGREGSYGRDRSRGCPNGRGCNEDMDYDPGYTNHHQRQHVSPYGSGRSRSRGVMNGRHTIERERSVQRSDRFDEEYMYPPRKTQPRTMRSFSAGREVIDTEYRQPPTTPGFRSRSSGRSPYARAKSVDNRAVSSKLTHDSLYKTPVLCNPYAIEDPRVNGTRRDSFKPRSQSMPRQHHYPDERLEMRHIPQTPPYRSPYSRYEEKINGNIEPMTRSLPRPQRYPPRERSALPPSPRIMSPMGYTVLRQTNMSAYKDDIFDDSMFDINGDIHRNQPVPIWLCVLLVIGYILAGASIFSKWEGWNYLDSAYFCFITLTTIGFGDFVPAQNDSESQNQSIALCSLYLLFGISLLAMSFNLVQEEVISNVKNVARRLGIIKNDDIEE